MRRLLMPLTFVIAAALAGSAVGQGAFPAPLPDGSPPAVLPSDGLTDQRRCREEIAQLRRDAEARAELIRVGRVRKLGPREVCDLYKSYTDVEARLVRYVIACALPADLLVQLRAGQKTSNATMTRVCAAAKDQAPVDQTPLFRLRPGEPPSEQAPFKILHSVEAF